LSDAEVQKRVEFKRRAKQAELSRLAQKARREGQQAKEDSA